MRKGSLFWTSLSESTREEHRVGTLLRTEQRQPPPIRGRADENRWWKRCVRTFLRHFLDCCCSVYRTTSCCCARHRILRSSKLSVVAA
ncbi:hypothetical protein CDAR_438511 [Caerostris darwini]|uniref:Uncharacterized protein n=1 Tax=Caerostris darwini TaxID=1538125 RepID=A0AAV4X4P9_9ARAC|nr:hypothetical protein CDAR_438511 [Caerostris darwini]